MRGQSRFHAVVINSKFVFSVKKKEKKKIKENSKREAEKNPTTRGQRQRWRRTHKNHERRKS